jgi:hypothetical protein
VSKRSTEGQTVAWVALTLAIVAVASVVSLALFFAMGGPFGFANDVGNALIGILSALLAIRLAPAGGAGMAATGAAVIGAIVTVIGSGLVIAETTGFFLAGLVSSVGFALIGAWLLALSRSASVGSWPSGLRTLGRVGGVAMLFGVVAVPGILMGVDNMDAVPPWLWAYSISWLGTYILYPAWSLWFGRRLLRET